MTPTDDTKNANNPVTIAAIISKLRSDFRTLPNLIGPAYGARFCDWALDIERALFGLKLWVADIVDIPITDPGRIKDPDGQFDELGYFPGRFRGTSPLSVRNELRRELRLPELNVWEWPKGRRGRMPPLEPIEIAVVMIELKDAHRVISDIEAAITSRRPRSPRDNEGLKRTRKAARVFLKLCERLETIHAQTPSAPIRKQLLTKEPAPTNGSR